MSNAVHRPVLHAGVSPAGVGFPISTTLVRHRRGRAPMSNTALRPVRQAGEVPATADAPTLTALARRRRGVVHL